MLHLLRRAIPVGGSISFEEYLRLVLYDPQWGYYGSGRARVGWSGDFFTNVSVSSLYGELLAGQFLRVWEALGRPSPFYLIEQGAHDGRLMADVLQEAEKQEWWPDLHPVILEPHSVWQEKQAATLARWADRLRWVASPDDLRVDHGVCFSNELVDALPFLLVEREHGQWWEKRVGWSTETLLTWVRAPAPSLWLEALARWPEGSAMISSDWPEPYATEFRPAANEWMQATARIVQKGAIFLCDYGYARADFYAPHRSKGTLWCYQNQRRDEDPLAQPGEKDISAHVEFTSLTETAIAMGWQVGGFLDQHHFLVGAAEAWLRGVEGRTLDPVTQKKLRCLQTLLHPDRMGRQFQFLVLQRGLPASALPLPCCQHARSDRRVHAC